MKIMLLCATAVFAISSFSAPPLEIPPEPAFTVPVPFPEAVLPEGRLHKPTAPEWTLLPLDGPWKFREVPFVKGDTPKDSGMDAGFWKRDTDDSSWESISVPSSWYYHPNYHTPIGKIGYYRRSVILTEQELSGKRFILDFRRAASRADVWINGIPAGPGHFGQDSSFQYDITALLRAGENRIAVRVYDYVGHKTYWRRKLGGLIDSVRLISFRGDFYIPRAMITPDLKTETIGIRLHTPASSTGRIPPGLRAELYDASGRKTAEKTWPHFQLPRISGWQELGTMPVPAPRLWSPEDPHLYTLRFRDSGGNTVGYETFGFREFKADGEWLFLNGKKFKPRMYTFHAWTDHLENNVDRTTEKTLRVLKDRLHVNMIRPHSDGGMHFESLYQLCDRIGMLVYADWAGARRFTSYDKKWNDSIQETTPELLEFIRDTYWHPSIVMWSFGNEIYESMHGLFFSRNLDRQYEMAKALDLQNRPICSSSGRQTLEAMRAGLLKERSDIADDHQYRGAYCGSWQENISHIKTYAETAAKYFGPIPKINAEYGVPGDTARYRNITGTLAAPILRQEKRNTPEFKEAYIKLLRDPGAVVGHYIRLKSNYSAPEDYIDRFALYKKFATRYAKRPIEIYRRAGVQCLGGHTNAQLADLMRDFKPGWNQPDAPTTPASEWKITPFFHELARLYNPTLVSAGVFNRQPYAGVEETVEVFVTNDLNEDAEFEVIPQLRLENGTVLVFEPLKFGMVPAMEQKRLLLRYGTPETGKIERGDLEFYLFKNGKRVGDNRYDLAFFPKRFQPEPWKRQASWPH